MYTRNSETGMARASKSAGCDAKRQGAAGPERRQHPGQEWPAQVLASLCAMPIRTIANAIGRRDDSGWGRWQAHRGECADIRGGQAADERPPRVLHHPRPAAEGQENGTPIHSEGTRRSRWRHRAPEGLCGMIRSLAVSRASTAPLLVRAWPRSSAGARTPQSPACPPAP